MPKGEYTVTKYNLRGFIFKLRMKSLQLGVVMNTCNPSTQETRQGIRELEAKLDHIVGPCLVRKGSDKMAMLPQDKENQAFAG